MVHITIMQDGTVTGDKGKIIGYADGKEHFSEPINIVHPSFTGCEYYIEYRHRNTLIDDKLDAYGNVCIHIITNGHVPCQLIAKDVLTGAIVFRSKQWHFIVKPGIKVEPSHYPCPPYDYRYGHHNHYGYYDYNHHNHIDPHHNHCCHHDDDILKYLLRINEKLENEEEIRHAEIQEIVQELYDLKSQLHIINPTPSCLDANELIDKGLYLADETSINFPKNGCKYQCEVSLYENIIMQVAYEMSNMYEANNVWYRTGTQIGNLIEDIEWDEWKPFITTIMEV